MIKATESQKRTPPQPASQQPFFSAASDRAFFQPKLSIGAAGDRAEQEADRVATQVMEHLHAGAIAAQNVPPIQRQALRSENPASADLETGINQSRGSGQPLAPHLQAQMGQAMGANFSGVRVHTSTISDQLNRSIDARAFTTGQDVFFRQGEYQPSSRTGQQLIAHELTHTIQQGGSPPVVQRMPYSEVKPADYQQKLFERKAEEYEFKLGYALSQHPQALAGATALTDGVKALMQRQETELKLTSTTTGKVPSQRASEVFDQGNLRERMGLLYSVIRNGLGTLISKDAKAEDTIVDKDLVETEQATNPQWMGFERTGKQASATDNDRINQFTQKELSKRLESFFTGEDAPTANKVKARGEVPLSTRELEALFPQETTAIQKKDATWNTLSEDARQAKYLQKVGNLPLGDAKTMNWAGGTVFNALGTNLIQEGKAKDMRMLAGFSGTTDMYLHLGKYLKLDVEQLEKVRLAALGTMIPARDHSYHEIMVASTAYGLDYTDGPKGAGYAAFRPFTLAQLKQLTGLAVLPNAYLSAAATQQIKSATDHPEQTLTARIPTRAELPKISIKTKFQRGKSNYEKILDLVDRYHAAIPAERYGIADAIVGGIDLWLAANTGRTDSWGLSKKSALMLLRSRAIQAGTTALVNFEGAAAQKRLTGEDPTGSGVLAFSPELVIGMTGEGAMAFERLVSAIDRAVAAVPLPVVPASLPALRGSPIFTQLKQSGDFITLVAALEEARAEMLLACMLDAKGQNTLTQPLPATDPYLKDFQLENAVLTQIVSNYTGVNIVGQNDPTHPRAGKFKLEGGQGGIRQTMQGARGLTPAELDAVFGYTGAEYAAFTESDKYKTTNPTRFNHLVSALKKLPKAQPPLYRGDWLYQNNPGVKWVGKVKPASTFTSTGTSLEDSFIPTKGTAHVYLTARSAASVEGLSKKTWEREGLFGPTKFKCIAVVNKTKDATEDLDATFDQTTKTLSGAHGLPTAAEQDLGTRAQSLNLRVGFEDGNDAVNTKVAQWYTEKFSNKVWMFWEEV
jgi:hypothetical protein